MHHIALSPDERFVYTAAGLVANPPDDDGAIDVFRRRADGSIMQLPGAHGCVKRPHPVEGREGCGVARGIEGARFIVRSADGRFLYVGSPTGIAISTRDTRSGTLRQLRGTAGCISQDRAQPCARAKAVNTIEDIALSADQRSRTRSPTTTTLCSPSVATRAREHCAKWTASPSLGGRLIRRRPAAGARVPSTGPVP